MLKRIQEIKNVGTFQNSRAASIELSELVLIYGSNSQGKTTLCDIIKSLKNKEPSYINERTTACQQEKPSVKLGFSDGKSASFSQGRWILDTGIDDTSKIEVFDTCFVYDNVFTNGTIEHKNKENFTKFIIGEASVKLTKELEALNLHKKCRQLEERILSKIKGNLKIEEFIRIPFKEDVHEEDNILLANHQIILEEENNKKDISLIKKLQFPKRLELIDINTFGIYGNINPILNSSYSFKTQDLMKLYNEHKDKYIADKESNIVDAWLLQGTSLIKGEYCPFCGSNILFNDSVKIFMEIFSQELQSYHHKVQGLKSIKLPNKINTSSTTTQLLNNDEKIRNIRKKIFDDKTIQKADRISTYYTNVIKAFEACDIELCAINELFVKRIEEKSLKIYESVSMVSLAKLKELLLSCNNMIKKYNELLDDFLMSAKTYIENLTIEKIDNHIKKLKIESEKYTNIVLRNELNQEISTLANLEKRKDDITKKIIEKKKAFDTEQEYYLVNFYDDINAYFKKFGSRNFEIEKAVTPTGNNKTYSLNLRYKGQNVPKDKIQFVLSESDRRALALAIFFTKIKRIATEKTILFLDDPITSFDIERMNVFINEIKILKRFKLSLVFSYFSKIFQ